MPAMPDMTARADRDVRRFSTVILYALPGPMREARRTAASTISCSPAGTLSCTGMALCTYLADQGSSATASAMAATALTGSESACSTSMPGMPVASTRLTPMPDFASMREASWPASGSKRRGHVTMTFKACARPLLRKRRAAVFLPLVQSATVEGSPPAGPPSMRRSWPSSAHSEAEPGAGMPEALALVPTSRPQAPSTACAHLPDGSRTATVREPSAHASFGSSSGTTSVTGPGQNLSASRAAAPSTAAISSMRARRPSTGRPFDRGLFLMPYTFSTAAGLYGSQPSP